MENTKYKRIEERLSYQWPVLFAEDFTQSLSEGVMVDVSSGGIAFMCNADENCPSLGQLLKMRFSIPHSEAEAMTSITREGRVLRVEEVNSYMRRVAIQFNQPLTLKPCEQVSINCLKNQNNQF